MHTYYTRLGEYFIKKSVNRAAISRKTGISTSRLNTLCHHSSAHLRVTELYLIATAIDVTPCELLQWVCIPYNSETPSAFAEEPAVAFSQRRTVKGRLVSFTVVCFTVPNRPSIPKNHPILG